MKRILFIAAWLICSITCLASIAEWKNFFAQNITSLDPIEGIYDFVSTYQFSMPGNSIGPQRIESQIAIHKDGNYYKMYVEDGGYFRNRGGEWFQLMHDNDNDAYYFYVMKDKAHYVVKERIYIHIAEKTHFSVSFTQSLGSAVAYTNIQFIKSYPTKPAKNKIKNWTGTGWALKDGYIVTNFHCVDSATNIFVKGVNGDFTKEFSAVVASIDRNSDLAIIKINDENFHGFEEVPYSIERAVCEVGETVWTMGYPMMGLMGEEIKYTDGKISSRTGFHGEPNTYQITVPIQPGNSGGPLFDESGNVVGITSSGLNKQIADNVNYAIKTSYLFNLIESTLSIGIVPEGSVEDLPLTEQIKTNKNFVYQLYFTNAAELIENNPTEAQSPIVDNTPKVETPVSKYRIIENPYFDFWWARRTYFIQRITVTDDYTIFDMYIDWSANMEYAGQTYNKKMFVNIDPNAYIQDKKTNKIYKLLKSENVATKPNKTTYPYGKHSYRLFFERIPDTTSLLDLKNGGTFGTSWKYDINLKDITL